MNLDEKENYDQKNQNFQVDRQSQEADIDAPPFDNAFSQENQHQNQQYTSNPDTLSKEGDPNTKDSLEERDLDENENLEDEDLEDEDLEDEDLEDENSSTQQQSFRDNEFSDKDNFKGL